MSNRKPLFPLVIGFVGCVLVVVSAIGNRAQQRNSNTNSTPSATPTPGRGRIKTSNVVGNEGKGSFSKLPMIHVQISWSKELGLPYNPARPRPPYPVCTMFRVLLTVQDPSSGPGTFGVTRTLAEFNLDGKPTEDSHSYRCSGYFPPTADLPRDRPMVISAALDDHVLRGTENRPWPFGSDASPSPGQHRAIIIIGGRTNNGITLTGDQPRQSVEFQMVYSRNPQPPS